MTKTEIALITTTPEVLAMLGSREDTEVTTGTWGEEAGFVGDDEGPAALAAAARRLGVPGPAWTDLTDEGQRAIITAAASSSRWRSEGQINEDRLSELMEQEYNGLKQALGERASAQME